MNMLVASLIVDVVKIMQEYSFDEYEKGYFHEERPMYDHGVKEWMIKQRIGNSFLRK